MLNTNKIELLRKKALLKQNDFVEKLNISRNTYFKLLKNRNFRASSIETISELFGVPVGFLFDEVDENGNKTGNGMAKEPRAGYGLKERVAELKGHLVDKEKLLKMLESGNAEHIEKIKAFLIRQDWCLSNCEDCEGLTFKV